MGKEVASLYATLGLQDKGLKNGLTDAKSGLGKVAEGFEKVTGISLKTATAWGIATAAGKKLYDFLKQSVEETENYVTAMTEGARITGMTVEEYSRLTQVADDVFLSQEKLTTIMQAAARQGTDVSIPGLQKLSAEYNSLSTAQEKAKFTAEKFGRTGLEMYKVLELGADKLSQAMANVPDSLVVTDQKVRNVENYKRSVDNLTDAWQGFKYQIGTAVIPQLDLLLRQMTRGEDEVEQYYKKINSLNEQLMYLQKYGAMSGMSQEELAEQIKAVQEEIDKAGQELDDYSSQAEQAAKEQDTLNSKFNDFKTIVSGSFGKEIRDFNESLAENEQKQKDIQAQIDMLNGKTWLTSSQKKELNDLKTELEETMDAAIKLRDEHETTMKTMALNMLMAKAESDGLTETEITNLTKIAQAWGLWDDATATAVANVNKIDLSQAELTLTRWTDLLNQVPESITTKINVVTTGNIVTGESKPGAAVYQTTHAAGGSFMLPASAGYEGVNLGGGHTASGNEMVTVSNQNQITDITKSLSDAISMLRRLPADIKVAVRDGALQASA